MNPIFFPNTLTNLKLGGILPIEIGIDPTALEVILDVIPCYPDPTVFLCVIGIQGVVLQPCDEGSSDLGLVKVHGQTGGDLERINRNF